MDEQRLTTLLRELYNEGGTHPAPPFPISEMPTQRHSGRRWAAVGGATVAVATAITAVTLTNSNDSTARLTPVGGTPSASSPAPKSSPTPTPKAIESSLPSTKALFKLGFLPAGVTPEILGYRQGGDPFVRDVYSISGDANADTLTPPRKEDGSVHSQNYLSIGVRTGALSKPILGPPWQVKTLTVQGNAAYLVRYVSGIGDRYLTWSDGKHTFELVSPRYATNQGVSGLDDATLQRVAEQAQLVS